MTTLLIAVVDDDADETLDAIWARADANNACGGWKGLDAVEVQIAITPDDDHATVSITTVGSRITTVSRVPIAKSS